MPATQLDGDQIQDGGLRNADIASDAAIEQSKIDGLVAALAAILPSQSGMAGKFLTTNGYTISWSETGGETCNVETLNATKTLTATDAPIQLLKCNIAQMVNLPTTGLTVGKKFEIWNRNNYNSIAAISVNYPSVFTFAVYAQACCVFRWDGTAWHAEQGIYNAAYGSGAMGYTYGASFGCAASGYTFGGALGFAATGYNYSLALGAYSNTYGKGANTIALGTQSRNERNREIVSTATESTTNKAQFTIQKYVEKNLATAAAAWQELFIDGSSARLTIIASSVYNFRAQINAIDVTTKDIKTWEIIGTIKRNAANVTSIVGTPTVTIIAADTAAANWDARITADDTNESLKVEVKHDSANNVRFSLNIIATETRV